MAKIKKVLKNGVNHLKNLYLQIELMVNGLMLRKSLLNSDEYHGASRFLSPDGKKLYFFVSEYARKQCETDNFVC